MKNYKFVLNVDIKQIGVNENVVLLSPDVITNQIVPAYKTSTNL